MQLNEIELSEKAETALRLCARLAELKKEIKAFVGEANLGCDEGVYELRRIASEGVIAATNQIILEELERKA
jgi:hypothetical protein